MPPIASSDPNAAIADEAARVADMAVIAAANPPPPTPTPETPLYQAPGTHGHGKTRPANAADIAALEANDFTVEDELRKLGRVGEADEHKATRATRMAAMRAELGYNAPTVNPEAVALAEIGRVPAGAKPSDYFAPDLARNVAYLDDQAQVRVGNAMAELAAANSLTQQTASWVGDAISRVSAEVKAMDPDARENWRTTQTKIAEQRAGGYVKWKERMEVAHNFLKKTEFGRDSFSILGASAELVETIWNLEQARIEFEKSRKS